MAARTNQFLTLMCALFPLLARHAHASAPGCSHSADTFRCLQYVRNYDGDTVTFQIPDVHPLLGSMISVRLLGVDTPEMTGLKACERQLAIIAKDFVTAELGVSQSIELRDAQRDKYFRILGRVRYDGSDLSNELIAHHLALPYDGGSKEGHQWCELLAHHQ
jgi:micrococcal nuclease